MKLLRGILIAALILGLIAVRMVEETLFYDPFQKFFGLANKEALFPAFEWLPLIVYHIGRFLLNTGLSAGIVLLMFRSKKWMLQAVIMMVTVFVITFPIYLYCISTEFQVGYLFSFYMRRFVIQPLILLLIIPLFYYRKFKFLS